MYTAFGIPVECCRIIKRGHAGLEVKNLKISVKLGSIPKLQEVINRLSLRGFKCKAHSNFVIARGKYVNSVFASGHVNITGVKRFSDIPESIASICEGLNLPVYTRAFNVDNITVGAHAVGRINLQKLYKQARQCESSAKQSAFKLNFEVFPALYYTSGKCTCIIFATGSIIIVGCKSLFSVHKEAHKLCSILEKFEVVA